MAIQKIRTRSIATLFSLALAVAACAHDESGAEPVARSNSDLAATGDGVVKPNDGNCDSCPQVGHKPDPGRVYDVPVGDSPIRGQDSAKVTIVVACDFECGYCKRGQPTLEQVRDTYGNSVRLVFKHNPLPFHKEAMNAALAAEAAREQGKFWEMHDLLLAHQHQLGEDQYAAWAEQLGLDVTRFETDLRSSALRQRIEADQRLVRSLGGKGTPSFWVNGRFLNGAQPFRRFRSLIFGLLADRDATGSPGSPEPATESEGAKEHDCGCEGE